MKAVKIVLGVLLLMGGLNNLTGVFRMANAREAAGYLVATFFFIGLGSWLLYSGIRKQPEPIKITDDSE